MADEVCQDLEQDPAPGGRVLVVGAALVDDLVAPTRLLAARRTAPPALAGGWELPGGKVEPGEEPQAALHRELAEELGVAVELGEELIGPLDGGWPLPLAGRRSGLLRVWLAVVTGGEPAPLEDHDALRWLTRPHWRSVRWLPVDEPVVAQLERRTAIGTGSPTSSPPATTRGDP